MRFVRVFIASCLIVVAAIASAQFGPNTQTVRYRTLTSGSQSSVDKAKVVSFGEATDLQNYWGRNIGAGATIPRLIEWAKDRIVIVHLGNRKSGGFSVRIQSMIKGLDNVATINAVEEQPAQGQITTQSITSPFIVLAVDRSIADFKINWTTGYLGGVSSIPNGSTVVGTQSGYRIICPPLQNGWAAYCVGYDCNYTNSYCGFLGNLNGFYDWSQQCFGRSNMIDCQVNWAQENVAALHVGVVQGSFSISVTNVVIEGTSALIKYSLVPTLTSATQRSSRPYALVRLSRNITQVRSERIQ